MGESLPDALSPDDSGLQCLPYTDSFQNLFGRASVGCDSRVGNRQETEISAIERRAAIFEKASGGAPEHNSTDRIGRPAPGDGQPLRLQVGGPFGVRCKEEIKRCSVDDLSKMLAGRAVTDGQLVSGANFEFGDQHVHGGFEIACNRQTQPIGFGADGRQRDEKQNRVYGQSHCARGRKGYLGCL